ncbi:MAG: glutathione S-transferase family protein [Kordiimonadaceae bacterium]|nr:glutathione S-transferase family protein [Kordiimonadaceae bacterium]MBO6567819.1 glutathione S-transferase family protein [Kordiimonadaceae bacterium]MBO6962966.1 glutathione S-transferase family protein [Kordiimonadaceae bacterium]
MSNFTLVIGNKNYSSWSLRGWLALKHAGLEFEEIKIDLYTPESKPELLKHSPTGMVPLLKHGDVRVWDSLAIIDYCARLAPDKFWWPESDAAYAYARSITSEMHSGFFALRNHAPMNLRAHFAGLDLSEEVEADVRRIEALWTEAREAYGAKGDFLFGEFSAADMLYAPVVHRFNSYGIEVNDTCKAYMVAVLRQSFMQEWAAAAAEETAIIVAGEIPKDAKGLG